MIQSLEKKSSSKNFLKISDSIDENVLKYLVRDKKIKFSNEKLSLLWECCQIPDFQKKAYTHIDVVQKVFNFLISKKNRIPNDYMKSQLRGLDKYRGNIDMISNKISNVRTWSYVANKKNWVENSDYWIQLSKNIEDNLSDKLHTELTRSFIDKRISVLSRGLKQDIKFNTEINSNEQLIIDGQLVGRLKGLKLNLEFTSQTLDTDVKSLKKAARQGIEEELRKRVEKIIREKDLALDKNFKICWKKNPIAKIKKGKNYLSPEIEVICDDAIDLKTHGKLYEFLKNWISSHIKEQLSDLIGLITLKNKNQYIRALAFRLYESNGIIKRNEISEVIDKINKDDRKQFKNLGIKIGRYHIFLPKMLKPKAVELRVILWNFFNGINKNNQIPKSGLNFISDEKKQLNTRFMLICGFEKFEKFFIRVDILEKLFLKIIEKSKDGKFEIDSNMVNLLGCTKENFLNLMNLMNYKKSGDIENTFVYVGSRKERKFKKFIKKNDNPFQKLQHLSFK